MNPKQKNLKSNHNKIPANQLSAFISMVTMGDFARAPHHTRPIYRIILVVAF